MEANPIDAESTLKLSLVSSADEQTIIESEIGKEKSSDSSAIERSTVDENSVNIFMERAAISESPITSIPIQEIFELSVSASEKVSESSANINLDDKSVHAEAEANVEKFQSETFAILESLQDIIESQMIKHQSAFEKVETLLKTEEAVDKGQSEIINNPVQEIIEPHAAIEKLSDDSSKEKVLEADEKSVYAESLLKIEKVVEVVQSETAAFNESIQDIIESQLSNDSASEKILRNTLIETTDENSVNTETLLKVEEAVEVAQSDTTAFSESLQNIIESQLSNDSASEKILQATIIETSTADKNLVNVETLLKVEQAVEKVQLETAEAILKVQEAISQSYNEISEDQLNATNQLASPITTENAERLLDLLQKTVDVANVLITELKDVVSQNQQKI